MRKRKYTYSTYVYLSKKHESVALCSLHLCLFKAHAHFKTWGKLVKPLLKGLWGAVVKWQ